MLGRVITGEGGDLILAVAQQVLRAEFPELAERIRFHIPGREGEAARPGHRRRQPARHSGSGEHNACNFITPPRTFSSPMALAPDAALARTTHLCISAHQDDIEIMAYHGIAECFGRTDRWFTGVVVTNGAGSPRSGIYGELHRRRDAEGAAWWSSARRPIVGEYACQIQLGFTSARSEEPARDPRWWRT